MSGYRSFAYRMDVDVPVERLWRAFNDSRILQRWTAPGASVVPRERGRMLVVFAPGVELDAHIDVLIVPQRMRLILLPTEGMPDGEAVIIEDFLFEKAGASASVIRLLSSGVPAGKEWVAYYLGKRRCWELALTRLKVFLEKGLDKVE